MPSFSIITAVRNSASTLWGCIESVKRQSYPTENRERIIIDGSSTDGTLGIVDENRDGISFVISEPDSGIYDAMNKGLELAKGDVIGIPNADDLYADSFVLEKVAGVFEDPAIDSCYGDLVYIDVENTDRPVFQKLGLEWLPRLLRQPRRLWTRTLISAPVFLWLVLKQKLIH